MSSKKNSNDSNESSSIVTSAERFPVPKVCFSFGYQDVSVKMYIRTKNYISKRVLTKSMRKIHSWHRNKAQPNRYWSRSFKLAESNRGVYGRIRSTHLEIYNSNTPKMLLCCSSNRTRDLAVRSCASGKSKIDLFMALLS